MNNRIYLRALELDDYKTTIQWRKDAEIENMVGRPIRYISSEREKQWIHDCIFDESRMVLGICLKENDKLIGNVNIQDFDNNSRSCHIPILIGDKSEWGKGYATEARMMALNIAFNERNIQRVWAKVLDTNLPSLKMHEKCGYKQEGVMRRALYKNGGYHDIIMLSILKEEFDLVYKDYCLQF